MNARSRQLLLLLLLIALAAAIHFSGLSGYLTFEGLKNHRSVLEQAVATHYLLSVLLYIVLYILTVLRGPGRPHPHRGRGLPLSHLCRSDLHDYRRHHRRAVGFPYYPAISWEIGCKPGVKGSSSNSTAN